MSEHWIDVAKEFECSAWLQNAPESTGAKLCMEIASLRAQLSESQAREAQMDRRVIRLREVLTSIATQECALCWGDSMAEDAAAALFEDNNTSAEIHLPAPDLVGVIKDLSAALRLCGEDTETHFGCRGCAKALESTREIRERVGAM